MCCLPCCPLRCGSQERHFVASQHRQTHQNWRALEDVAKRAGLDPAKFDLKTFRSTYATGMLRRGFDVRTVQHWLGHKSLETTMRYLAPATDVHDELDLVTIPSLGKAEAALRKSAARETGSSRKARDVKSRAAATQHVPR